MRGGFSLEEPVEEAKVEEFKEEPQKGKRNKILALLVVVLILGGGGVWWLFFSNSPPVANFRAEPDDLLLRVYADTTTDPDGNIVSYIWNWGDSSPASSGLQAQHNYTEEGNYTVVLTAIDARDARNSHSEKIWIHYAPNPVFIARTERMTVTFDASRSFPSAHTGSPIMSYSWDFGDGAAGTGVQAVHTYSTPNKYRVWLNVTDQTGRTGSTSRFVSPANTTVDILADQFFEAGCPYGDYWFLRKASYGDVILNNNAPCTDFYPWVLVTAKDPVTGKTLGAVNPSYLYTLYRLDAKVRNHPGYNLSEPVILPVFDGSVAPLPTSYVRLNLTFDYLGDSLITNLAGTSFAVDPGLGDGFGYLVRGNITMDLQMSKRIFGVSASTPAEAQAWWTANTRYASSSGPIESRFAAWLEAMGKGKYDIYNAFEWFYVTDITDLNATVASDGTTTIRVFWDGWGFEVLLARWFYWGNASYRDAVCVQGSANPACPATLPYGAVQPQGWMPMETCWCERAKINATIRSSLDLDFEALNGYHFEAWGNGGSDGVLGTPDDVPAWVFTPYLMDYVPREGGGSNASAGYPNSEIRWYEGRTSIHGTPGSYAYGDPYEYLVGQTRWILKPGSTLTIVLPRSPVPWYDPVQSKWNPQTLLGDYVTRMANMSLRFVKVDDQVTAPGGFYLWDARGKIMSIAGPWDWGTTLPLTGSPWIEFAPEA